MFAYLEAGAAQLRPDGTLWPFLLISPDGTVLGADSASEVVDELIVGHQHASDDDRFLLRLSLLTEFAEMTQATDLANRREADAGLDDELGSSGLTALVAPKATVTLSMADWPFEVPLYLLTTQYAPFTEVPVPMGEKVVVLDPSDERTFLDALNALGITDLYVSPTSMVEAAAA